jgi:hypothetical protein
MEPEGDLIGGMEKAGKAKIPEFKCRNQSPEISSVAEIKVSQR